MFLSRIPSTHSPLSRLCKWTSGHGHGHASSNKGKKNLLLLGRFQPIACPSRIAPPGGLASGPLNRFWPSICWELRKIPNNQLSSGHGPNDRRSSSARRNRLEGLHAWPSNHGAPLPTAHLQHGAHQVTSALGGPTVQLSRTASNPAIPTAPGLLRASSASLAMAGPWQMRGSSNCCARAVDDAVIKL